MSDDDGDENGIVVKNVYELWLVYFKAEYGSIWAIAISIVSGYYEKHVLPELLGIRRVSQAHEFHTSSVPANR